LLEYLTLQFVLDALLSLIIYNIDIILRSTTAAFVATAVIATSAVTTATILLLVLLILLLTLPLGVLIY
jgi:hypothetical protein